MVPALGRGKNPPQVGENEADSFFRSVRFLSRKALILMAPQQQPQIVKLCFLQREVLRDVFSSADLRDDRARARFGAVYGLDDATGAGPLRYRYEAVFVSASPLLFQLSLLWRIRTREVYRLLLWELIRALLVGGYCIRSGAKSSPNSPVPRLVRGATLSAVSTFAVLTHQYLATIKQCHPPGGSRGSSREETPELSARLTA